MSKRRLALISDFLWPALVLSVLAHSAVAYLLWQPLWSKSTVHSDPTTALISYKSDEAAIHALVLAQWNAAGGGDGKPLDAASAPLSGESTPSPNELVLVSLRKYLQQVEQEHQARLSQLEAEWQTLKPTPTTPIDRAEGQADLDATAQLLAKEYYLLKIQLAHHNAQPRIHFDAPSAKASPYAAYIEDWRAKVERIGTEHYPDQAKGQLSDTLQMTVYIDSDGALLRVDIHQPAQNPIFNVAAQRIVRLASPFAPFSATMRQQSDVLAITRSWRFTQGNFTATDP